MSTPALGAPRRGLLWVRAKVLVACALLGLSGVTAAQVPAVVDAEGELLGIYAGGQRFSSVPGAAGGIKIVSRQGFTFLANPSTGDLVAQGGAELAPGPDAAPIGEAVYFAGASCTGDAYMQRGIDAMPSARSKAAGGFVFRTPLPADAPGMRFMVTKDAPALELGAVEIASSSTCMEVTGVPCNCSTSSGPSEGFFLTPALPNDPAVSGVANTGWVAPLGLDVVPFDAFIALFCDGFEAHPICAGR